MELLKSICMYIYNTVYSVNVSGMALLNSKAYYLIWPDAADGSLTSNAGYWLDYHGRITGIFEKPRLVGWLGLNRISVVSQGLGVSEYRRGRIVGFVHSKGVRE